MNTLNWWIWQIETNTPSFFFIFTPASRPVDSSNVLYICFHSKYAENQERIYLYWIISITAGILLCLIIVIGRLLIQKHRTNDDESTNKVQNSNTGETSLPNGFSDEISEIDADIDLTTSLPVSSVSRNEVSKIFLLFNFSLHPSCPSVLISNVNLITPANICL